MNFDIKIPDLTLEIVVTEDFGLAKVNIVDESTELNTEISSDSFIENKIADAL